MRVCLFVFVVGSVCVIFFCVHPTPYVSFKSRLIKLVRYKQGKTFYPSVLRLGACWGLGTMKAENKREKKTERDKYD